MNKSPDRRFAFLLLLLPVLVFCIERAVYVPEPETLSIEPIEMIIDSPFLLPIPPEIKKRVEPCYPDSAFIAKLNGQVLIEIIIDSSGSIIEARVSASQPEVIFDSVALDAAWQWKFLPALMEDKPVEVRYQIPFIFKLDGRYKRCSEVKEGQHE